MRSLGWRGLIGGLSVAAVVASAASDGPPASLSGFWSQHAMLTNLVSSAGFAVLTVTVVEAWVHRRQQRRLTVVRSAAYNAVARAPFAQTQIMWFLVHGGELRRVPEFEISETHVRQLRAILAWLGLAQTSEHDVASGGGVTTGARRPLLEAGAKRALAAGRARRPAGCAARLPGGRCALVEPVADHRGKPRGAERPGRTGRGVLPDLRRISTHRDPRRTTTTTRYVTASNCGRGPSPTRWPSKKPSPTRAANATRPPGISARPDGGCSHPTTSPPSRNAILRRRCRCGCPEDPPASPGPT